eukprot:TRINITY_DN102384_c0_g1_i1.p1 TRINITY_DN102384_c0_g1~~TRINITY_DN102384_c0_g1_i1.p1  ORF type:complete len:302 (-),score=111.78 TRINITY_DN102384_c0_g1_i1:102-1007(-)
MLPEDWPPPESPRLRRETLLLEEHITVLGAEVAAQRSEVEKLEQQIWKKAASEARCHAEAASLQEAEAVVGQALAAEMAVEQQLRDDVNASLEAERRFLLRAIEERKEQLGLVTLAETQVKAVSTQCRQSRTGAATRAARLRKTLQHLGDAQAGIAEEEVKYREGRRALRAATRERLAEDLLERQQLELRIAEREEEFAQFEQRMEEAIAFEMHAHEEAAAFVAEIELIEAELIPAQKAERDKLLDQVRLMTLEDAHLKDQLDQAQQKLWRKEQRKLEEGGGGLQRHSGLMRQRRSSHGGG